MKFAGMAALGLAALMGLSTPGVAATAGQISDGSGFNDGVVPYYGTNTRQGYYGANLYLTGTASIDITYIGAEAGYKNQFLWNNIVQFTTNGVGGWNTLGAGTINFASVAAGLLNFAFMANGLGLNANGSNGPAGPSAPPNFFVSFDTATATSGTSVVVWFDDAGSPDDNHDDMAIRISIHGDNGSIEVVPVPAAGGLLILALGGLAALKRRGKSA